MPEGLERSSASDSASVRQAIGSVQFSQAVAANWHSLALSTAGDVYGWGIPEQAGHSSAYAPYIMTPKKLDRLSNIAEIVSAHQFSYAVGLDGSLYCWGDCNISARDSMTWKVSGISNAISASTGTSHSLVLLDTGKIIAWGDNTYGQLGDGTFARRSTPQEVIGIPGFVVSVAAQAWGSLALTAEGNVYWWGSFDYNGGPESVNPRPVKVTGLTDIRYIAAGEKHALALDRSGQVWSWGFNLNGELGLGYVGTVKTINRVPTLSSIRFISAGYHTGYALATDGSVFAWGFNWCGLGDGTSTALHASPIKLPGVTNLQRLSAGNFHVVAIDTSRRVEAWGCNNYAQLGNGTFIDEYSPIWARTP